MKKILCFSLVIILIAVLCGCTAGDTSSGESSVSKESLAESDNTSEQSDGGSSEPEESLDSSKPDEVTITITDAQAKQILSEMSEKYVLAKQIYFCDLSLDKTKPNTNYTIIDDDGNEQYVYYAVADVRFQKVNDLSDYLILAYGSGKGHLYASELFTYSEPSNLRPYIEENGILYSTEKHILLGSDALGYSKWDIDTCQYEIITDNHVKITGQYEVVEGYEYLSRDFVSEIKKYRINNDEYYWYFLY